MAEAGHPKYLPVKSLVMDIVETGRWVFRFSLLVDADVRENRQTSRKRMCVLLMERLSLCRYAPVNHEVCSVV